MKYERKKEFGWQRTIRVHYFELRLSVLSV